MTQEVVQGDGCSVCSSGLGTYTFSYTLSPFPKVCPLSGLKRVGELASP